jgi:hypothetical protein
VQTIAITPLKIPIVGVTGPATLDAEEGLDVSMGRDADEVVELKRWRLSIRVSGYLGEPSILPAYGPSLRPRVRSSFLRHM